MEDLFIDQTIDRKVNFNGMLFLLHLIISLIFNMLKKIFQVMFHWFVNNFQAEAALQRCSYKKLFWKYVANLQENTHAEVQFQ